MHGKSSYVVLFLVQPFYTQSWRIHMSSMLFQSLLPTYRMSCLWTHLDFIYPPRPLISSPFSTSKLARTSLFWVPSLTYCLIERNITSAHCYGCQFPFPPIKPPQNESSNKGPTGTQRFVCPSCHNHFCIDCDLYCHEVLHNCPGCERLSQGTNGSHKNSEPNGAIDSDPMIID